MIYEYKVIPAPTRGKKARGLKSPADRFAHALGTVMNEMAAEGWQYLRTDTLPSEERSGLTGRTTVYQNMLVFRRDLEAEAAVDESAAEAALEPVEPVAGPQEVFAPKLPSAGAAQDLPETPPTPVFSANRKDMAAE